MNTVKVEEEVEAPNYEVSDIFKCNSDCKDNYYILSSVPMPVVGFGYVCINLATGYSWTNPRSYMADAIEGLDFYASGSEITISNKIV